MEFRKEANAIGIPSGTQKGLLEEINGDSLEFDGVPTCSNVDMALSIEGVPPRSLGRGPCLHFKKSMWF